MEKQLPHTPRLSQDSEHADVQSIYHSYNSTIESVHPPEHPHHVSHHNSTVTIPIPECKHIQEQFSQSYRQTLRIWLICALAFIILSPFISVMIGLHLHARDFQIEPDSNAVPYASRTISMDVVLHDANPASSTLTLDWTILGELQSDCGPDTLEACSDVNIFFDNNLFSGNTKSGVLQTSDRPANPIFRFNATTFALSDIVANTPTFRTQLVIFAPKGLRSDLIYYPFDVYTAKIFTFAQDSITNEAIGIEITSTRGIADGFKTHAVTCPGVYIPRGMVDICITLSRGNLVKAFSVTATIAIWLITIILLLVMLTCVFFGFRQKSEVLIIPVATVFAFTQIRQSMPGAPTGFGDILDFVGLLPCLALLSLTAAMTLGAFLVSDPTAKQHHLNWEILFEAFPMLDYRLPRCQEPGAKDTCSTV